MSLQDASAAAAGKALRRAQILARRRALPAALRRHGDLARDVVLRPLLVGRRVASYRSFDTEPRTLDVLAPGHLLPVVLADRDLDWVAFHGAVSMPGPAGNGRTECPPTEGWPTEGPPAHGRRLGVDAIRDCDIVLVPALAVDRRGVRLGRGGGSYDRALRRTNALLVALLHDNELVDELPVEPHDVGVHLVATPTGLHRIG